MKKKEILLYLSTFIILAFSFIFLLVAFYFQTIMSYFLISAISFVIFAISNKSAAKGIACKDGYNLVQALLFYKRCLKNNLNKKPSKLTQSDILKIKAIAAEYEYSADFNNKQLQQLYTDGYETAKLFDRKK